MGSIRNWILGSFTGVMAVASLFEAARAGHGIGYYGGLVMFVFLVIFSFVLIKTGFDHK